MKKVFLALGLIAALVLVSCSKECNCKVVLNGETVLETVVDQPENGKCSDIANFSGSSAFGSGEVKCTSKLF